MSSDLKIRLRRVFIKKYVFIIVLVTVFSATIRAATPRDQFNILENLFEISRFTALSDTQKYLGIYVGRCVIEYKYSKRVVYDEANEMFLVYAFFRLPNVDGPKLFPLNYFVSGSSAPTDKFIDSHYKQSLETTQNELLGIAGLEYENSSHFDGVHVPTVINESYVSKSDRIFKYYYETGWFSSKLVHKVATKNFVTSVRNLDFDSFITKLEYDDLDRYEPYNATYYCTWYKKIKSCSDLPYQYRGGVACI